MKPRRVMVATGTHGRCLVQDARSGSPRALIVGFHGYAQTAEEHLEDLRRIPAAETYCLAALQALHPFYRNRDGEIGASWMTRQDREQAIADNAAYVGRAVDEVRATLVAAGLGAPPLVYVGFSQGASMAWRAATLGGRECAGVVALGGDIPAELTPGQLSALPPSLIGQGREDRWYGDSRRGSDVDRLRAAGADVTSMVFDGGHEWHDAFQAALGEYLDAILGTVDAR